MSTKTKADKKFVRRRRMLVIYEVQRLVCVKNTTFLSDKQQAWLTRNRHKSIVSQLGDGLVQKLKPQKIAEKFEVTVKFVTTKQPTNSFKHGRQKSLWPDPNQLIRPQLNMTHKHNWTKNGGNKISSLGD